ncbi:undecaprenyldiphospho-muramoylpentapeptide beta-N-acetylglucosaminyltransferase [Bacillus seohaeanensis]|jgi:UDP-N-acetylglucosamine--N-acetylmuramyl-(pentapeptide) pyrophosphoryl-undecaprenol N-acetylglucosamine transferase|uniref:UDP-N-acetylglucosamine--N-acetylmuramyl-(pentapeptide) pyrophosphoryl-undecaprenol N-acetylglucosamine transferase n=1 Tax=Bacillus seohaeanensis TaxID=284580 RepID=A0ABW5RPR5_9BACI
MSKHILFTGGGSAGHVTVNTALIPFFEKKGWDISYIGSRAGIENEIITDQFPHIPFYGISSGKLRRYFSWKNFTDPFLVMKGVMDALSVIRKTKPDIIFSKGGFVSVPVVMAAKIAGIPVAIHESDVTPGLANKLAVPFATKIFTTFPETVKALPENKTLCAGSIIREELFTGDDKEGKRLTGYFDQKPILMIMGGSLGAKKINESVRENLKELLKSFQIVHICGKGNIEPSFKEQGYKQFEFIKGELPHYLAMTDFVISRAGSNSIFEFLALKKPMLLIPLSREASRGDQILNANSFVKQGFALKLEEEELTPQSFMEKVKELQSNKAAFIKNMEKAPKAYTIQDMYEELTSMAK